MKLSQDSLLRLLKITAKYDWIDTVRWNEALEFFVLCNDCFAWACSDHESIENDLDIDMFQQACIDGESDGALLYCARRRKMRPQGAMYRYIDHKNWPLFDACGPEREIDFSNPHKPDDKWPEEK